MKKYTYKTNCVNSTARLINDMVDNARQITWKTFCKYVAVESVKEVFPDYSYRQEYSGCGFHIKDDYAVSFYKSTYRGKPCVYIYHSAIEYIFA